MGGKIKIFDKEYDSESLSDTARAQVASLSFITKRVDELRKMKILLQRAKNSYANDLKKEVLSDKAGILFNDD